MLPGRNMTKTAAILMALILSSCAASRDHRPGGENEASGYSGIFRQLYPNWTLLCDDPAFATQRATIEVELDRQGRIVGEPVAIDALNDPGYRAVALSGLAALRATEPFAVPAGFPGGKFRPMFNAERACAPLRNNG